MPCHDPIDDLHKEQRKDRLDLLTRNACKLCGDIDRSGTFDNFATQYPELAQWYRMHQKEDEMREEIKRKQEAGEPLTDEERNFGWSAFA